MQVSSKINVVIVLLVVTLVGGCSDRGPATIGNMLNNYPPKIRGAEANLPRLMVHYQPYDAYVNATAYWTAPDSTTPFEVRLQPSDPDTTTGSATFTIEEYTSDTPWQRIDPPAGSMVTVTFTVAEMASSRRATEAWQFIVGEGVLRRLVQQ